MVTADQPLGVIPQVSNTSPGSSSANQDDVSKPQDMPPIGRQESTGSSASTTPKSSDMYSPEARMQRLHILEGVPVPEGIPLPHSTNQHDWLRDTKEKAMPWELSTPKADTLVSPANPDVVQDSFSDVENDSDDVINLPSANVSGPLALYSESESETATEISALSPETSRQSAHLAVVPKAFLVELLQSRLLGHAAGPKDTGKYDKQCLGAATELVNRRSLSEKYPHLVELDSELAAELLEVALTLATAQRNVGATQKSAMWLVQTEPALREVLGTATSKAASAMDLSRLPELNPNPFQSFRMWRLFRLADLPKDKTKNKRASTPSDPRSMRFYDKLKNAIPDPKKDLSRQLCDSALEEVKNNAKGFDPMQRSDLGQLTIRHYIYMTTISADEYLAGKRSHKAGTMIRWEYFRNLHDEDRDGFENHYRALLPILVKVFEDVLQSYEELHCVISLETHNRFAKLFSAVWDHLSFDTGEVLAAFQVEPLRSFREAGFLDVEIWIAFVALVISLGAITEHEVTGITLDVWCRKVLASIMTTEDTGYLFTVALYHTVSFEREGRPYFEGLTSDIRKLFGHEKCPIPDLAKFSTRGQAGAVWMNDAYLLSNPSIGSLGSIRNKVTRRGSQSSVSMVSQRSTSKSFASMVSPSDAMRKSWSTFGSSNNILGQNITSLRSLGGSKRSSIRTTDDDGDIKMGD